MSTKVFVGNLNFKTESSKLTEEFGTAGNVVNANIITRGPRSLGYGFVEFASTEDAEKAVQLLNQKEIDGRPINVELAKPRQEPVEGGDAASEGQPAERKPRRRRNHSNSNNNTTTSTESDSVDADNFNEVGNRRPQRRRRNFSGQGQGQQGQGQLQGHQGQGQLQQHQGYQGQQRHQGQGQPRSGYRRVQQQYRPREQHDGYQQDNFDQGQEGYSNTGAFNNTGHNGGRGYNNNNYNNTGGYSGGGGYRNYPRQRFHGNKQPRQQQQDVAPGNKPVQPRTKSATPTQRPKQRERIPSKAALFVANLPFSVEDAELLQIFSEKMAIQSAHVVKKRNGRSKGFGFVEFNTEEDQLAALQAFEGLKVHDRTINVKIALVPDEAHQEGGEDDAEDGDHPAGDHEGEQGAHDAEGGEKPAGAETTTEAKAESATQPEKTQ